MSGLPRMDTKMHEALRRHFYHEEARMATKTMRMSGLPRMDTKMHEAMRMKLPKRHYLIKAAHANQLIFNLN